MKEDSDKKDVVEKTPKKKNTKKEEVKKEELTNEEVKELLKETVAPPRSSSSGILAIILVFLVTFFICAGCAYGYYYFYLKDLKIENTKLIKDVTVTDNGIADAVEKVYDSVVVVETYLGNQKYSSGTGFVFKTDDKYGYIMTNNHVVASGNNIKVMFTNDEQVDAEIVGSDKYIDIAILVVDKKYVLSVAETRSSEEMRLGDTTFAVGSPIDSDIYSWSVTRGILSGKDRVVEVSDSNGGRGTTVMKVLQTDTPINAGNSGGPLCNSNGEVIGVTNMKLASSSIEGMSFAVPIEEALKYADKLMNNESVEKPYLGVGTYDASGFFNDSPGVYIQYVEPGSTAEKIGLQKGDKILSINKVGISNSAYFKYELYKYEIGDKIIMKVERNKKEIEFEITLTGKNQTN